MFGPPQKRRETNENTPALSSPPSPASSSSSTSSMSRGAPPSQSFGQKLKSILHISKHSPLPPVVSGPSHQKGTLPSRDNIESHSPPSSPRLSSNTTTTTTTTTTITPTDSPSCSVKNHAFTSVDITHDTQCCMFKIKLDAYGNTAALCYLPTQFKHIIEFYHTELPRSYRNMGVGDLLACHAFAWAASSKLTVIPTCPFIRRYLSGTGKVHLHQCINQTHPPSAQRLMTRLSTHCVN